MIKILELECDKRNEKLPRNTHCMHWDYGSMKKIIPEYIREYVYHGRLQIEINTDKEQGNQILKEFSSLGCSYTLIEDDFDIIISINPEDWVLFDSICQKHGTPYTL